METLTSSISQVIDSGELQRSVPEYLWFTIAIGGIVAVALILMRLVNYLITTVGELREGHIEHGKAIVVMQEMLSGFKIMLADHEQDIRNLQSGKRNRGQ